MSFKPDQKTIDQYTEAMLFDGLLEEVEIDGEKQLVLTGLGRTLLGLMERKPEILEQMQDEVFTLDEIIQMFRD
jgi:hypothetical protein